MQLTHLRHRLRALGALPQHEDRILRLWIQALPQTHGKTLIENLLPARLRADLPAIERDLAALGTIDSAHPAEDGSERLLVRLADGQLVESVLLLPDRTPGLCVSTQMGCAVGCQFCMTGTTGLIRQLSSMEILAQVVLARQRRPVRKVVFMGMGEPAHNLDEVLEAIDLLGTLGDIGHKNLVLSTVGDPRVFEALPRGRVKPALALSLHTTRADLRERLLPRAPRMTPEELVEAGEAYARVTGYPIQIQWTLLKGINDTEEEIEGLIRLLRGRYAVLNLIPYNTTEGMPFERPPGEEAAEMARRLHRQNILTKLRLSAGQDVDGGCGQLRARAEQAQPVRPIRLVPEGRLSRRSAPNTTDLAITSPASRS